MYTAMTADEEWAIRLKTLVNESDKLHNIALDLKKQLVCHYELTAGLVPRYHQNKMVTPMLYPRPPSTATEQELKEYKCGLHAVICHMLKKYNLVTQSCIDDFKHTIGF
jgi:hypothetical protein